MSEHLAVVAADVERDEVRLADQAAELRGAPDARGRPRFHHGDRDFAGGGERVDPAIRLHDVERAAEAGLAHREVQPAQIGGGDRLYIGGENGCARALVFAPLAGDLVRRDGRHARPEPPHLAEDRDLVGRIRVGVQQADRHRLDAGGPEPRQHVRQAGEVERHALPAPVVDAARHLGAQVARHEGARLHIGQVEEVRPVAAGDFEDVPEPGGGDERRPDALAFGQRIDDHRRAMGEDADVRDVDPALPQHLEHAPLEIRRGRLGLGGADDWVAVAVAREGHEVGEGAPDIGGDAQHGRPGHRPASSRAMALISAKP